MTVRGYTKDEHERFANAAMELFRLYSSVGDMDLAGQWHRVSIQHKQASARMAGKNKTAGDGHDTRGK